MKHQREQQTGDPRVVTRREPLLKAASFSEGLNVLHLLRSSGQVSGLAHEQMTRRIQDDSKALTALGTIAAKASERRLSDTWRFAQLLNQMVDPVRRRVPDRELSQQQCRHIAVNLLGVVSLDGLRALCASAEHAALLTGGSMAQAVRDTLFVVTELCRATATLLRWDESNIDGVPRFAELGALVEAFNKTPNPMDPSAPVGDPWEILCVRCCRYRSNGRKTSSPASSPPCSALRRVEWPKTRTSHRSARRSQTSQSSIRTSSVTPAWKATTPTR